MSEDVGDNAAFHASVVSHSLTVMDTSSVTIRTRHAFILKAARVARFFERTYQWTGSGIEKDPKVTSGRDELGHTHKIHGPVLRDGQDRHFLVDLGRNIAVGEEVIVDFEHLFVDIDGNFKPFLGHTVKSECDEVDLEVILPVGFAQRVMFTITPSGTKSPNFVEDLQGARVQIEGVWYEKYRRSTSQPTVKSNHSIEWVPNAGPTL